MGLVRTMGRTAVIAGTATAVSGNVQRRQMGKAQQQQAAAAAQQQQAAAAQQAAVDAAVAQQLAAQQAAAPAADDVAAQIAKLGDLVSQGLLSPEEFAAAKAKLLGL